MLPIPGGLSFLKDLIEAGTLRTVIDKSYPLDRIAEAHRLYGDGPQEEHAVTPGSG
jgi:NADPH2:quinone reductase